MVLEIDSIPINMIPCHVISGFTAGGYLSTPLRVQSTSRVQCVKWLENCSETQNKGFRVDLNTWNGILSIFSIFGRISGIIRLILTINCHVIGQNMMIFEAIIVALSQGQEATQG